VGCFEDDAQIAEIHYRRSVGERTSYGLSITELS
jgi:Holliday junction resolvase RusA-like endonuclease